MSTETYPTTFELFCALLSPCTPDDDVGELRRIAAAGGVDWPAVAEHANRADLAPALCVALESKGLAGETPQLFREYLHEIHRFNLERNQALLNQLREVVGLLNGIGVTPLLLKGAAALVTDLYADPGMRFMVDLDLLVPEEELQRSVAALQAVGYEVPEKYRELIASTASQHYPPLARPGEPATLEIHRRVLTRGRELLESARVWDNSRPNEGGALPGLTAALMSPTDALVYCFAHSELAHASQHYERIDARSLLEFAHLFRRYRDRIDWPLLESLKQHPRYGLALEIYLHQARMLFRLDPPLSGELSPRAERHFSRVTSYLGWRGRQRRLLRVIYQELYVMFSEERLRNAYGQQDVPLRSLRLRHFRHILGRYCRPGAWKGRLGMLKPH